MAETVALIVAAGRGERAGGGIPKQYRMLAGKPVLRWTIEAFRGHPQVDAVQAVIHGDDRENYEEAAAGLGLVPPIVGGATRADSVRNGLNALGWHAVREPCFRENTIRCVASTVLGAFPDFFETLEDLANRALQQNHKTSCLFEVP